MGKALQGTTAFTRQVPWCHYGKGNKADELMTPMEALELAEANFTVSDRPLFLLNEATGQFEQTAFSATCRDDNHHAFSTVKSRHENFDNIEVAYFAEDVTDLYGVKMVQAAWCLKLGATFGMAMKVSDIPDVEFKFLTDKEKVDFFLILNTSHDGSSAFTASVCGIRMACTNAINMAIRQARKGNNGFISIRHTTNARDRVAQAQAALGVVPQYAAQLDAMAERMAEVKITEAEIDALLEEFTPIPEKKGIEKAHQVRDDLRANIFGTPTVDKSLRSTRWGVFNAVTEFFEHEAEGRHWSSTPAQERAMLTNFGGKVGDIRQRAWSMLSVA